jgi:hypothetical protein
MDYAVRLSSQLPFAQLIQRLGQSGFEVLEMHAAGPPTKITDVPYEEVAAAAQLAPPSLMLKTDYRRFNSAGRMHTPEVLAKAAAARAAYHAKTSARKSKLIATVLVEQQDLNVPARIIADALNTMKRKLPGGGKWTPYIVASHLPSAREMVTSPAA